MRPDTQLDYAVFQLNPTRTRCELHISAQGMAYKLAAGLLQPFVAHLSAAEEQVAGGGYSITLEPPDPGSALWFTKGTMERFVRFVSTPEVLERVSTIETELIEIERTIRVQSGDASEDTQNAEESLSEVAHSVTHTGGIPSAPERLEKSTKESFKSAEVGMEETTKQQLLRALEARRMMLQKELGVALARAIAAGFNVEHIGDLIEFAETFGAKRLWKACSNFMSLYKMRQQCGVQQDDLKLSAAEVAQAEVALGGYHMSYNENPDLLGRGAKQNDFRRASLPSDGRLLMGDSGLEKLTRRGSLDELTGEFMQVAARMRSSGMMEGVNADWSNNWQAPMGGGNRPVSEEMQGGVAHVGGNSELRDTESALKLARGYQIMAAWRGQPQNHSMHFVHPPMHGPMHSSLPSSFGFAGLPRPGVPYPPYPENPYMGNAYAEANGWHIPALAPPPYWPHPMFNSIAGPAANKRGEGALPTSLKQEVGLNSVNGNELHQELPPSTGKNSTSEPSNVNELHGEVTLSMQKSTSEVSTVDELHGEPPSSTQKPATDQFEANELHVERLASTHRPATDVSIVNELNGEQPDSIERSASDSSNANELHEEFSASAPIPSSNLTVKTIEQTVVIQEKLPIMNEQVDDDTNDSFHDEDGEPFAERTRRMPIRSSSPSRRSASPMRKVQIGRSGSRRSGAVATRNANHVARSIQEQIERENNDRDSSESWSEDNGDAKKDEEPKEQPIRARVQDVIGLFERKIDVGDSKGKPVRKESGRIQPKNAVLRRWTESGAMKIQASEIEDSVGISQIQKGALVTSAKDSIERGSNQLNMSEKIEGTRSLVQEGNEGVVAASEVVEQLPFNEQPAAKGSTSTWKSDLNLESEVPGNKKTDDDNCDLALREQSSEPDDVVPESNDEVPSKLCMDYDIASDKVDDVHPSQEKNDADEILKDGQESDDGVNPEVANSKKAFARDAKAKAMQELLERRKAASGNRNGKPNPLAEAQLRAEKLRAYKAGLQKSKQEKDEEEKKRIEDLKSQRKERIAARSSPVGSSSVQSPVTIRQAPQTPPLTISRSSPTVIPHKFSGSSPGNFMNVSTSLSPNVPKSKAATANKLPRTPAGTPKANENALSRSVPSLSELKKESPKATLAVRSSTGSQRLKKNLKDVDPNSSPKANGHSEEKRRSLPLAPIRKGIPPAKDIKNETSPVVRKTTKSLAAASKHQKKPGSSPASQKPKKSAEEAADVLSSVEQVDAANDAAVEVSLEAEREVCIEDQALDGDITEASVDNICLSLQEVGTTKDDDAYAQIRAPASIETEVLSSAECASSPVDDELATSCEPLLTEDSKEKEVPIVVSTSHTDSTACSEGEHIEADGDKKTEDNYCAPIAQVSAKDENSTTFIDLDASKEDPNVTADELPSGPPAEDNIPLRTLPSDSPLHTLKSLPRLHEAIQQAHSPEFIPEIGRSSKTRGDEPSPQKSSKDHAKGLKKLFLLGRKSGRTSTQNTADCVPVSVVSEVGDDGEGKLSSNVGIGAAPTNTDSVIRGANKLRVESNSGNSSSKGSRSFFSLSTFRGKSEGKL